MIHVDDPHKRGPKLTRTEREEMLAKVAALDRRGWHQHTIAAEVGVSQKMVSVYLKKIRQRYKDFTLRQREETVGEKLAQLRDVRREAWAAWDFSNARTLEEVVRQIVDQQEDAIEKGEVRTEFKINLRTLPGNEYLGTILKTIEQERELLGLDEAPKKAADAVNVNVQNNVQLTLWDTIAKVAQEPLVDRVEQRLQRVLEAPAPAPPEYGLKEISNAGAEDGGVGPHPGDAGRADQPA